jgi:hypothetical protein
MFKQIKSDNKIKPLGSIQDIRPCTEEYLSPLQLKFYHQDLIGVGHRFAHIYDLKKFKQKFVFNVTKKEVVSCFDFQENGKIIAMGKYSNNIDLFNLN